MIFLSFSFKASAERFQSTDIYKVKKLINELKSDGIEYKIYKKHRKVNIYSLLLKDSKKYRNLRIKRIKKVIFKNKLHFVQYSTPIKSKVIKALELYTNKGFIRTDLIVVSKKRDIRFYTVKYTEGAESDSEDHTDDTFSEEIADSETTTDTVFDDMSYSYKLAQSKLKIEKQLGHKNSYDSTYGNLLAGVEFESEVVSMKIMGRLEFFDEKNENRKFQDTKAELDETYINFEVGKGQITLGKQLFSWGTFDEFSNLDRVNIKNSPRFIFDSGESYRRPITAIRYEYYSGNWKVDSYVDFGLEPGREMNENSLWTGINLDTGEVRGGDPDILNSLLVINVSTHFKKRDEMGYGLRITNSGWGDLSFSYLSAYPDLPVLEFSELLRQQVLTSSVDLLGLAAGVNFSFFKEDVYGLDFTKTFAGHLYKIEFSYISNSLVLTNQFKLKEIPKTRISLGGDLEFNLFSTTLTWQVISEQVNTSDETLMDKQLTQYVLNTSSRFIEDKLETGVRFVSNQNDKSSYVSPYLNFDLSDSEKIGFSTSIFTGNERSFFGYHSDDNFSTVNFIKLF
jgi:hypothetical protein